MNDLIIYNFEEFQCNKNDVFIIGCFEAFHLGHYQLYKEALKHKGRKIIVTFNNETDTRKIVKGIFCDNNAKYLNLAKLNFDAVVELDFEKIKHLQATEFINQLTQNQPVTIIAGTDFKFGNNRNTKLSDLIDQFQQINFISIDLLKVKDAKISTKYLKDEITFGNINQLNQLLVYNYSFSGITLLENYLKINDNVVKLHPGIYAGYLYYQNFGYYIVLHVSLDKKYHFSIFEYQDSFFEINKEVVIELVDKVRIIINSNKDLITDEDLIKAKEIIIRSNNGN
ncbi:hypothetical protein GE118_02555 [Mycoplasma sp. NEAQ87857]|uniref:FAD synthase n=1 Tax=Mycoplasma sp. NEAQ87857 TaxID=2683967 RepID=UPI001319307D|nr:hypothetical protein [Mycoplasma sp. NEAQ87857]QGZ97675.1 hypothetical protein GE118_02555 [Mycoplasma sp. NEAQ87857]